MKTYELWNVHFLNQIIDTMAEGLFTLDDQGIITSWNRAMEKISGFTALEAVGQRCDILKCSRCYGKQCPATAAGGLWSGEHHRQKSDPGVETHEKMGDPPSAEGKMTTSPMQWKKTTVIRADQKKVPARAPVIISASRATDIPAFYADWLINRLKAGYAVWVNPFNKASPLYVSFDAARLFVFWTKNPRPLMSRLDEFEKRSINYYFQFTLNDYEPEKLEPRLPPLHERIHTFRELSDKIGRHRVIWRFDPLIITPGLSAECLLEKIASIGSRLMHKTDKLVVSFVDVTAYQKVQNSLIRELDFFDRSSVFSAEPSGPQIRQIARGLEQLKTRWYRQGWDITVATCGESMDLKTDYGIVKNKCIDDDLIRKTFSHDRKLMRFVDYGETDPDAVRQQDLFAAPRKVNLKDKGQRKACNCIWSKDIGMYDTCPHFCVYCYANTSRNRVNRNFARHSSHGECLVDPSDPAHL